MPLDASGFTASIVGTVLFALVTLVFWLSGHTGLWLEVFVTGTALGLVLTAFTAWHRYRRSGPSAATTAPTDDDSGSRV